MTSKSNTMKTPESKVQGVAFARIFTAGSQLVSRLALQGIVTGDSEVPNGGWFYIARRANTIAPWVHFVGDSTSTRFPIPRLFPTEGLLGAEKGELDELQAMYPQSRQAVAIRSKDAVMVGPLAIGSVYPVVEGPLREGQTENNRLRQTTPRIGYYDGEFALGVYRPEAKDFVPASTAHSLGRTPLRNT